MPPEVVLSALCDLLQILRARGLACALMGGLALSFWRHPRFTKDVDLLVLVDEEEIGPLIADLNQAGFLPKHADPRIRLGSMEFLQLLYEPPDSFLVVQVDLLLVRGEYQRQAVERRVVATASELGFQVDVLSCEDLILHKLLAGRIIDLADAAALLRANRERIDFEYLRRWSHEQGVVGDLSRVWNEAFPDEPLP